MARFICHAAIVPLIFSVSVLSMDVNDIHNYMLLITDVHSYYSATCIIIVHSGNHTSKFTSKLPRLTVPMAHGGPES